MFGDNPVEERLGGVVGVEREVGRPRLDVAADQFSARSVMCPQTAASERLGIRWLYSKGPGNRSWPDQLDPLDEVEPPGPSPRRRAHHAKRRARRLFDRIGQMAVTWSERV